MSAEDRVACAIGGTVFVGASALTFAQGCQRGWGAVALAFGAWLWWEALR